MYVKTGVKKHNNRKKNKSIKKHHFTNLRIKESTYKKTSINETPMVPLMWTLWVQDCHIKLKNDLFEVIVSFWDEEIIKTGMHKVNDYRFLAYKYITYGFLYVVINKIYVMRKFNTSCVTSQYLVSIYDCKSDKNFYTQRIYYICFISMFGNIVRKY